MKDTILIGIQNVKTEVKSDQQPEKQHNQRRIGLAVNITPNDARKLEVDNKQGLWAYNLSITVSFEDITNDEAIEIGGGSFEFDAIFSLENDHGLGGNYWKEKEVELEVVSMIFCAKRESISNLLVQSGYPRLALPYNINHRKNSEE